MSAPETGFPKVFAGPSRWLDLIETIGDYVFTEDDSPWECRTISAETVERFDLFVKNAGGSE